MIINNWQNFIALIPIAVVLSIIVFLVRFFGKAIADQAPFADNRTWLEEISGVRFFTFHILSPLVWVFLIYSGGIKFWLFSKENLVLFIVSIICTLASFVISKKALDFFSNEDFDDGDMISFFKKAFNLKKDIKFNAGDWFIILKYLSSLISFGILIALLYFYIWGAYYYIFIGVIYLFSYFTFFAILQSLSRRNILLADIKFISDNYVDIKRCRILKINDDSIRIKTNEGVSIISKSLIFKIDVINKKL